MAEHGQTQTVTITSGQITAFAAFCLVLAVLISSVTLAVSIINYDRTAMGSERIDNIEVRVLTLEAYESTRSKKDGGISVQSDPVRERQ